jgi:uncharacterized damage-inducible protein DinB
MSQKIEELKELFIRDLERLESELTLIDGNHLWETSPGIVNSVGVLTQHIVGNLNHFIGTALGNTEYIRNREKEFTETGISAEKLINDVNETSDMVVHVFSGLKNEDLNKPYPMDIPMDYSIHKFLLHLYGHLIYHLGQVNYLRRILSENES